MLTIVGFILIAVGILGLLGLLAIGMTPAIIVIVCGILLAVFGQSR